MTTNSAGLTQTASVDRSQRLTAEAIDDAALRLGEIVRRTPLEYSARLSAATGAEVWLKREDLQLVRSYKLRGAYNFLCGLPESQRHRGVVCASAGNHAQGVAWACARLGIPGRIYVPTTTTLQKRERIAAFGGSQVDIIVTGDAYEAAFERAVLDSERTGAVLVPAFDALQTMAGQGTVAVEILAQLGHAPDRVIMPVGGGGLIAGMATWLTARAPNTVLIGVEADGAASMTAALRVGRPVPVTNYDAFVDGAAVRTAGHQTFPIVRDHVDAVVTVPEGRVCVEMLDLYQQDGIVTEPAGALATAALGGAVIPAPGESVVCVISGGNNDVSRYAEVIERALLFEGRKYYFLVEMPQEPGSLRRFLSQVLGPGDDITHFEYIKRNNREYGPALIGVELADADGLGQLLLRIKMSQLQCTAVDAEHPLFALIQ